MNPDTPHRLYSALVRILRPLIRIMLRHGISYGTFADFAKWIYIDIADREFGIEGRRQSVSRISVITGLTRKEVVRVRQMPRPDDTASSEQYNRASRVIAGWRRDPEFLDGRGRPAVLSLSGEEPSFSGLVRKYSGDMPFRAVLDELERVGAAECDAQGRVRLIVRAYVPLRQDGMKIHILGADVASLIETIDHNLRVPDAPFYQRKVLYDNLPDRVLPEFRELAGRSAQALLEKLDRWLSRRDRDVNPSVKGAGRQTAGLGIYYFEEPHDEKKE
jgi:hypothetical protein